MPSLFFWKEWTHTHRIVWYILTGFFVLSILLMWFHYFQGAHGIIEWEKIQQQKTVETSVHDFRLGPFELSVPVESYVIFEYLQGSDISHNMPASYIFLALLIVSSMVILAVITTLPRFWYFAGMALFILFIFSLRLEVLLVFGQRGYIIPIAALACFAALSFYFQSFSAATPFAPRLISFLVLSLVWGLVIYLFSGIPYPLLHLAVTAYLPAMILCLLFLIMVAHEILASFVYLSAQGSSKSLQHFSIVSLIYMVNVMITCLHEMGVVDWQFLYINLYLLLTISALLGIWGFKLREPQYENILSFYPAGAFFYAALGTICFATVGQYLGNANDAALRIIRDIIIFSHTGFGIIFLTYIFSNFMVMMAENLQAYKVLYRPSRMPYFTFRLAGLIATLAFVFYSNWRQYVYHGLAGFYNYAADLYVLQDNEVLAQSFYEQSRKYAFQNNRANYALATIKSSRINFEDAHYNYELANGRNPTEFSLVNAGNLHLWTEDYFPAIKTYREGKKILPESAALANNLSFAYARVHHLDSSTWFINEARQSSLTKNSAEGNFFALAAVEYLPIRTDSVVKIFDNASSVVLSNALALATLFDQQVATSTDPIPSGSLDLYTATLLNNYIILNARSIDTTFIKAAYRVADDSLNFEYAEALKASLAHAYYLRGNVTKALEILGELAYVTQGYRGKYNYIMGLWALEQHNPQIASSYFMHAETADYKHARFYNAIALTEAGRIQDAFNAWAEIAATGTPEEKEIAIRMQRILFLNPPQALQLNDPEKYQYCRYKIGISDTTFFSRISNTFNSADYKAQALLDMAQKQFRAENMSTAIRFLNQISGLELTDRHLYEEVRMTELLMLAYRGELQLLATQINQGVEFNGHAVDKILYTAMLHELSGETARAGELYRMLGTWNPYFEEGVIAAANFFRKNDQDPMAAYHVLVEAIQVNYNSYRLLKAYAAEAERMGFDAYAASARERVQEIAATR